jgi:hypothetical protein
MCCVIHFLQADMQKEQAATAKANLLKPLTDDVAFAVQ